MNKRSLTVFELIVTVCLIFILAGTFATYANKTLKAAREIALQNELVNIRMSLEHFRVVYNKFPDDLSELVKERLTNKNSDSILKTSKFLKSFRVDQEGCLLDPFLNRYAYDNATGAVYSQTKEHERW